MAALSVYSLWKSDHYTGRDPGEGKTTMVLQIIAKLTRGEQILPVTDTTKTKEKQVMKSIVRMKI